MATTLPTLTETLDDKFTNTWYEIRDVAIDNILSATPIWNALMGAGCFTEQMGGRFIERTVRYGEHDAEAVEEGDVLASGEPDLDTVALWNWKHVASNVQRNTFQDQENRGPHKIQDYVGKRITAARDGLEKKFETDIMGTFNSAETGKTLLGLNSMIPSSSNYTSGTYGGIQRPTAFADSGNGVVKPSAGNTWWGANYLAGDLVQISNDLDDDMKKLYNSIHNNQQAPNLVITTQTIFEVYETFAVDISQIIKDDTTRLADLGFEVLRFKGKPMMWAGGMDANTMMMLNTDWIEIVYDPEFWFVMTDWKPGNARGFDRAAQIFCSVACVSDQLRRHGRLLYS